MNRTYNFFSAALLASALAVSAFAASLAKDDMPMSKQSMASPQSAVAQTQAGLMKGRKMSMGQQKSEQSGSMTGGVQEKMKPMGPIKMTGAVIMNGRQYNMRSEMQPIGKTKGMSMSMDLPMKMNGKMTLRGQEYRCNMSMTPNQMAPMGQSSQMSDQEMKKEFNEADKNHDGYIDFNELVIHEGGDKNRAKLHFNDADRNKDGKVDEAEWIRHHKESSLHKIKDGAK